MATIEQVRKARNIPFIKRGMRVKCLHSGRKGRIAGVNSSMNLNIIFDGWKGSSNCHPHFKMRYLDDNGQVIQQF